MAITELTHLSGLTRDQFVAVVNQAAANNNVSGVTIYGGNQFAAGNAGLHWYYEQVKIADLPNLTFNQMQNALDAAKAQGLANAQLIADQARKWDKLMANQGLDGIIVALARAADDIATATGVSTVNTTKVHQALAFYDGA